MQTHSFTSDPCRLDALDDVIGAQVLVLVDANDFSAYRVETDALRSNQGA